jgi:hypothetical protein
MDSRRAMLAGWLVMGTVAARISPAVRSGRKNWGSWRVSGGLQPRRRRRRVVPPAGRAAGLFRPGAVADPHLQLRTSGMSSPYLVM